MELDGRIAPVAGGSSGIGLASARALRERGARVALIGSSAEKLEAAYADLGADVLGIGADVTSLADLPRAEEELTAAFGGLEIVVANAGFAMGTPIATADEATFDRMMEVNVEDVFFTVQALLSAKRADGLIILKTSWLNKVGAPWRAAPSAKVLDLRIRGNAVSPNSIEMPIHRAQDRSETDFGAYAQRVGAQLPTVRMGKEGIVAAVLFLASDASSYMPGAKIVIDAGRVEPWRCASVTTSPRASSTAPEGSTRWRAPAIGIERRMLSRIGDEKVRATSIVRYAPASHFARHATRAARSSWCSEPYSWTRTATPGPAATCTTRPEPRMRPAARKDARSSSSCGSATATTARTLSRVGEGAAPPVIPGVCASRLLIETWHAHVDVAVVNPRGLEMLVLDGFQASVNQLTRGSWLGLPPGGTLPERTGGQGARLRFKSAPLMHADVCRFEEEDA